MKILMKVILVFMIIHFSIIFGQAQNCYLDDYVEISSVDSDTDTYDVVAMKRSGDRIKAKYFAARDYNGKSVYERYKLWKKSNPNVVLISSGTYMNNLGIPVGLTIDNGIVVNQSIKKGEMDALVIIYATGGVVVSNLKEGNLSVDGINRNLNISQSGNDFDDFIEWAKANEATVFQTHLLVYGNELKIDRRNSTKNPRERRFLAVGKNEEGEIIHSIVFNPEETTLYNGSLKVKSFINDFKDIEIIFMINLDTGMQNVFELYNSDCSINSTSRGWTKPKDAANLLVYYFN